MSAMTIAHLINEVGRVMHFIQIVTIALLDVRIDGADQVYEMQLLMPHPKSHDCDSRRKSTDILPYNDPGNTKNNSPSV
jgi:hypothetical protein